MITKKANCNQCNFHSICLVINKLFDTGKHLIWVMTRDEAKARKVSIEIKEVLAAHCSNFTKLETKIETS